MSTVKSIDLDDLSDTGEATQRVGVAFNDDAEPTVGFIIVGKDSSQYRETAQRLRVAGIKRGAVKSTRIDMKTEQGALEYDQTVLRNELELAVAVTVGWFGFTAAGAPAAFSEKAVRDVYAKRPTWRERVSAALENEQAFLSSSPTSSESSPATSSA
jgi:hypothetical protein